MNQPVVSSVRVNSRTDVVEVGFRDGHKAVFVPNWAGVGLPQNIVAFRLERRSGRSGCSATVASFNSQHQHPICRRPFGFVSLDDGYTVARVAEYWRAAHDHVAAAFAEGHLANAWSLMWFGGKDLQEIEAGQWPAPSSG